MKIRFCKTKLFFKENFITFMLKAGTKNATLLYLKFRS